MNKLIKLKASTSAKMAAELLKVLKKAEAADANYNETIAPEFDKFERLVE